jgi:PAS domain S-box-containing protein
MGKNMITHTNGAEIYFADELLKGIKESPCPPATGIKTLSSLHDLQEHEIDLELLNTELRHVVEARTKTERLLGNFTNLYDYAPAGYFTLDPEGIIRAANQTGADVLGVKRSQLVGRRFEQFVSPQTRPDFHKFLEKLFAGSSNGAYEIALQEEGISTQYVQIEAMAAAASAREFCIVVTDVTERKRAEDELRKAKKEVKAMRMAKELAESATRAKSQFLAVMSHELRTQMCGIHGLLQIALGEDLDPKLRNYLEGALHSSHALLEIVNDTLDMAKIEAGKLTLEEKPFSLRSCVSEVADNVIAEAGRKGLGFEFRMPQDMPEALAGDQLRLRQVLVNLIGNAVKFTDQGEVTVQVSTGKITSNRRREVTFAVTDTGIGIPEDKKSLLFRPFSQLEASHGHSQCGTGLGLSISRELVHLMGGTLCCKSKVGVGSTFSFTIPLGETKSEGASKADARPNATETIFSLPGGRMPSLLLAEDDPTNRQVFEAMFKRMHVALDIAEDGRQALEMWEKGKYDLVLMDVEMPRLNGFEAACAIREKERTRGGHTPIVAITAHALQEIEQRCLAAGIDSYISKPIDLRNCLQVVGEMLRKNQDSDGTIQAEP